MQDEVGIEGPEQTPDGEAPARARFSRRGLIAKGAAAVAGGVGLAALTATPAHASTGLFTPITPFRVCDTRAGTGTPFSNGVKVGPGVDLLVMVAAPIPGFPVLAASAIIANLTVTEGTAPSYLTVYPADVSRPTASNINFVGGQTIANQVTVGVAADGNIKIYNNAGSVHVILDIAGFFL